MPSSAAVYDLESPAGTGARNLKLNIPPSIEIARGILIYGNGIGGDSTDRATDTELTVYAESMRHGVPPLPQR